MTIQGEKLRLIKWLRQALSAGARLSDRFETQAAAAQLDRDLETYSAQLDAKSDLGIAANFATGQPEKPDPES